MPDRSKAQGEVVAAGGNAKGQEKTVIKALGLGGVIGGGFIPSAMIFLGQGKPRPVK